MEIWKPVRGYEGKYSVSSYGLVRNEKTGKSTLGRRSGHGYRKITFYEDNKPIGTAYVHRLVADAFLDPVAGTSEVNHKDGNREHNHVDNLEWVTSSGNTDHAVDTGALVPWNNARKPIIAINIDTGEMRYFKSISLAEKEIGSRHIDSVLSGKRSHAKGYAFRYANGGDANVVRV